MRIGILGTGTLGTALGAVWVRAGHEVLIGGRSAEKATAAALASGATAATPAEVVRGRDAVLVAVLWDGMRDVLALAGAAEGSLAGTPLIDPSNAVEHGVGDLLTPPGRSAAEQIADWAPGAAVVKAFHLFPAAQWGSGAAAVTVPIAGDDEAALARTSELVRDAGGLPAVLGPLRRARQLEEVAGFVIGLAFAGVDPNSAIPSTGSA